MFQLKSSESKNLQTYRVKHIFHASHIVTFPWRFAHLQGHERDGGKREGDGEESFLAKH